MYKHNKNKSQRRKHTKKHRRITNKRYYIEAYDHLNDEYYQEVYETESERLTGLKEFLERDDINLSDDEMEGFLKTKLYSYGYDWIELLER